MLTRIGVRGHDYGKISAALLSDKIKNDNFQSLQLAFAKAISGVDDLQKDLNDQKVLEIGNEFKRNDLTIAVLGCYLNYSTEVEENRLKNIEIFKKHLEYSKILNAKVVGTETFSLLEGGKMDARNHTKEGYDRFSKSLYELLEKAEDLNVDIAIEGVFRHIIYSPEIIKQLIDDMKSDRLKIILDPVNLLSFDNYKKSKDIISKSFDLFGEKITNVHLKDYIIKDNDIFCVDHGEGFFNYNDLLPFIKQSKNEIDVLIEGANTNKIDKIFNIFK